MTPSALTIDQYAEFVASADQLWSIIGEPRRLPEWTDVVSVRNADALDGWEAATTVTVREREETTWQVISLGQRVVEVSGATSCGQLGIGVRVIALRAPDAGTTGPGCRVVFVGRLEPSGSEIRARLRDLPALRRRFDRWAKTLRDVTGG